MFGNILSFYGQHGQVKYYIIKNAYKLLDPSLWLFRGIVYTYRKLVPNATIGVVSNGLIQWQAQKLADWAGIDRVNIYQVPRVDNTLACQMI